MKEIHSTTFITKVFACMVVALSASTLTAYIVANTSLITLLYSEPDGFSTIGRLVALSPLPFILIMQFGLEKLSTAVISILFLLFSICLGGSLSCIFLMYSKSALITTFGVSSLIFTVMASVGYTTKKDLSNTGSILFAGLIGVVLTSILNWFMKSPTADYIISIMGVIVFTGLIATDTQEIKRIESSLPADKSSRQKSVIMGALILYLNFMNLFLFLLRILGRKS